MRPHGLFARYPNPGAGNADGTLTGLPVRRSRLGTDRVGAQLYGRNPPKRQRARNPSETPTRAALRWRPTECPPSGVATEKGGEDSGVADDIVPNNILIYAKTEAEHISPAEQARVDQLGSYAIALGWEVEGTILAPAR